MRPDDLNARDLSNPVRLLSALRLLRRDVYREGKAIFESWKPLIHRKEFRFSAQNFAYYLAFRKRDLRAVQRALIPLGLSSLGRSESHVLQNLDAVIASLTAICAPHKLSSVAHPSRADFYRGQNLLRANADAVLGKAPDRRTVRIMVTLDAAVAKNYDHVLRLLESGMNCARINCAHDTPDDWELMIRHVHRAEQSTGLSCRVFMDLSGPKVRTGAVHTPPHRQRVQKGDVIYIYGNRPKRTATLKNLFQVQCTLPEILSQVGVGAEVWIDDGHIGTVVESVLSGGFMARVTHIEDKGRKLRPDKGLNFPTVSLNISPLTDKDLVDLDFIVQHADAVSYSFVQTADDIKLLQSELQKRLAPRRKDFSVVAKIETKRAVENLPEIIIQAAGSFPLGVMIARGDLAVEIGYQRIAEIQEELLWICEAAHVPVIWATQVLENLVKKGIPSRAEITDAAMSERAECVMLNKGRFIVEAVDILDNVLMRMQQHQQKKAPQLRALHSWRR